MNLFGLRLDTALAKLLGPPPRALGGLRREERLDGRVRRDDRPDVPALDDPVAVGDQRTLPAQQRLAHLAVGGYLRARACDRGRSDLIAHVALAQ